MVQQTTKEHFASNIICTSGYLRSSATVLPYIYTSFVVTVQCKHFGQLITLAEQEHRSILKAKLWNMTPLFPTQLGVALRTARTDKLIEDLAKLVEKIRPEDDDEMETNITVNLSTATLFSNYAGRTPELRNQTL